MFDQKRENPTMNLQRDDDCFPLYAIHLWDKTEFTRILESQLFHC